MVPRFKKLTLSLLVAAIFSISCLGVFLFSERASAQSAPIPPGGPGVPTLVVGSLPATIQSTFDTIWEGLKSALLSAASRIIAYGMRRIAYDSAVWLASGGKGQTPFAHTKDFGSYLSDVGNNALGQGIEALGRPFGLNLCKIPDIKVDLALRIGIRSGFTGSGTSGAQAPKCTMTQFMQTWTAEGVASKFSAAGDSMVGQLNNALDFSKGNSGGLLTVLDTQAAISGLVDSAISSADKQRQEGQGYIGKQTTISNQTVTPPGIVKKEFERNTPGDLMDKDEAQIQALLTTGDIKVIPNVISLFLNTLVSSMVRNYQEKGILPFGICAGGIGGAECNGNNSVANQYEGAGPVASRQVAEDLYSSFLTVNISEGTNYDVLSQLGNCASNGVYNCRADQGLISAARQSAGNQPVTIQQALDRKLLNGEYKLIPPSRLGDNADTQFCQHAYCYYNIKVLRQVRLLPLGFEIAVKNSDPDRPWDLAQVVKGFKDCLYSTDGNGNQIALYDPTNHPFCHLIDPNWIIKVPATQCKANVNSAIQLTPQASTRLQDCTDLTSCVAYNTDGTCANFGYCAREKNVWSFGDADKCDSQFRSCTTYSNLQTGETNSYLARTLDTASCSEVDSGCQGYSLTQTNKGSWNIPTAIDAASSFAQKEIFFNAQLPQTCSANSSGCTAFQVASSTGGDLRYLRKAPDYLGCYDADRGASGVQWPVNPAQINSLPNSAECSNYAAACIPDEVGCSFYTNKFSDEKIPGKISQNNVCAAECIGYNAYQELASNYSNGQSVAYIVPNSAPLCKSTEAGCSSFTNLSTATNGQEQVEYFTYLRPCELPGKKPTQTYTTFEGSAQGGFQLKSYSLVADIDGSPLQWYRVPSDLADYTNNVNGCTAALYTAGKANPDCRQFNDTKGNVYYKLLGKTIPVTDACTPYRLNSNELNPAPSLSVGQCSTAKGFWDGATCNLCFQNGEYSNGFCNYMGLPGDAQNSAGNSNSCTADVNACRAFRGNTGFNTQNLLNDGFEVTSTQVLVGWIGPNIRITTESTHPGEHSLGATMSGVNGTPVVRNFPATLGQSYAITFWAKGTPGTLTVNLGAQDNSFTVNFGAESVGDDWRYYSFGPIAYTAQTAPAKISFISSAVGGLFIDNFNLKQLNGVEYRIKNKLNVPATCDPIGNDNLPGPALGCSVYSTNANQDIPLTGFDFLCRENAIGCSAFVDTHNTLTNGSATNNDAGPRLYKVWLPSDGQAHTSVPLYYQNKIVGSCATVLGDTGCYVPLIQDIAPADLLASASVNNDGVTKPVFKESTVYIEGDGETAIYLVNNPQLPGQCSVSDLGCIDAGKMTLTPSGVPKFETVTIKNDPSIYDSILCKQEALGCFTYTDNNGGSAYFKDPVASGNKLCSFVKDNVMPDGSKATGWFWQGVGVCSLNTVNHCSVDADCGQPKICTNNGLSCNSNADCGGGSCVVNSCINIGNTVCYPNYIDRNNQYGIWSSGDVGKYKNFVGLCPANQNSCTEFVDHNDLSSTGDPNAYYFLKNGKISSGNCDGQVSLQNGCALLDETSNPGKYWSTTGTYAISEARDGAAVKPLVGNRNDANIILKVLPDRTCGEWIQCRQSYTVWDVASAKPKTVCQAIGRCDAYDPANPTECTDWVDGSTQLSGTTLDEATYVRRTAAWSSQDFAGISILDQFPVEEMQQVNISSDKANPDWRLVKTVPCGGGAACLDKDPNSQAVICDAAQPQDGTTVCGRSNEGVCLNKICARNIEGPRDTQKLADKLHTQICRAFPEGDSPFPNSPAVAKLSGNSSQSFAFVNVCNEYGSAQNNDAKAKACECDYTKANYGDAFTRFWSYSRPSQLDPLDKADGSGKFTVGIPGGLCQGGDKNGKVCSVDSDCYTKPDVPSGTCAHLKNNTKWLGWRGYCLEYDNSRNINANQNEHPCLTWYPIDSLTGALDINTQHTEAGYITTNLPYYCLNSNGGANLISPISNASSRNDVTYSYCVGGDNDGNNCFADSDCPNGGVCQLSQVTVTNPPYPFISPQSNWLKAPAIKNTGFSGYYVVNHYVFTYSPQSRDNDYYFGDAEPNRAYRQRMDPYHMPNGIVSLTQPIYLHDIDKITLSVAGTRLFPPDGPNNSGDTDNPQVGTTVELYPQDLTSGDGMPQNFYHITPNDNGREGHFATGRYFNRPNELVVLYGAGDHGARFGHDGGGPDFPYKVLADSGQHICYGGDQNCNNVDGNPFSSNGLTRPQGEGIWNPNVTSNDLCPGDNAHSGGDEFSGVRFVFDKATGKLKYYDTYFCNDFNGITGGDGGIAFEITYKLKEWCTTIADTTSPSPDINSQTAAWTDRLWKYRNVGASANFVLNITSDRDPLAKFYYDLTTATDLFGRLGYDQKDGLGTAPVNLTPSLGYPESDKCDTNGAVKCWHKLGATPQASYFGAPYSCGYEDGYPDGFFGSCIKTDPTTSSGGFPVAPPKDVGVGRSYLGEIFAKVGSLFKYVTNFAPGTFGPGYQQQPGLENTLTGSPNGFTYIGDTHNQVPPTPPQVNAVVPGSCDSKGLCMEDQSRPNGGISVNNSSSGDVLVLKSSSKVFVRFYMHADDNQMPLRDVTVDWKGDGTAVPNQGYFYNFRGAVKPACEFRQTDLCGPGQVGDPTCYACVYHVAGKVIDTGARGCLNSSQCPGSKEQCSDDPNLFGYIKSPNPSDPQQHITCQSHYYEAQNVYSCTQTSPNWKQQDQCGANKDLFPNGCCIFVPRVQVRDNWGWCNGTCTQTIQGQNITGCFDSAPTGKCASNLAWTSFAGRVLVAPNK